MAEAQGTTIRLLPKSATVWTAQQMVRGIVSPPLPGSGTLYVNGTPQAFTVSASGDSFGVSVTLGNGTNTITARIDSAGAWISSDTARLTLGYKLRPVLQASASVQGPNVTLHAAVIDHPLTAPIQFL